MGDGARHSTKEAAMALSKEKMAGLYRRRAEWYDVSANAYYLIGFRESAYRGKAVQALQLHPGDTVVEIGCGTGLNFDLLQQRIGPRGQIVGVDLTPEMLSKARERVKRKSWSNVRLVQSDAAAFTFPRPVDGVISTFALTLVPEYDRVIEHAAAALSQGKRMVILDFKLPNWPAWLIDLFVVLTTPFGVTLDLGVRHLWESVDRHLKTVVFKELYFGGAYICAGQAGQDENAGGVTS
jgi:demethylmenaquinone methyltransferase/2-methoxy-6-polyprenyl-1,4-benzoquinol methylase